MNDKKYRDELVARLKEIGQEIIDRAESMLSEDTDLINGFSIYIDVSDMHSIPTVEWSTTVLSKNTINRMQKEN